MISTTASMTSTAVMTPADSDILKAVNVSCETWMKTNYSIKREKGLEIRERR